MSFRHNVKSFVPKTHDKPSRFSSLRGRGRGGFVPKTHGRGYIPSHKAHLDQRSYSHSPKRHPGGSKHRRSYSRSSSSSSLSSISVSRSRSRSRGEAVHRRRRSPARKPQHVSAHKSREKKKPSSPEKLRHRPESSKTYRRPGSVIEEELAASKYRDYSTSTYPSTGGEPSGVSLLGPAAPASSYITLRSVSSAAMSRPRKLTLAERFTGPLEKPFKAGENVTIGIHRNIKLPGGRIPPPVNRRFNPDLFVMVHKRDYITQPMFSREEILKFRFDVELDEQLVQEKRIISVARDDRVSSRERRHSPFHDTDPHRSKTEDSGYRSRLSGITASSDLHRSGLTDISRDTELYGRSHQNVSRLAPSLDPRYENLLRDPPISDRPSLHLNPDDLRYNLMKRKQSDVISPIDFPAKKRYTSPLPRSPERRYDLSPRRRSHSPFERISRSLSPEPMPSKQRQVIDGSRNRNMSPERFTNKQSVFSELNVPTKKFSRERSFSRERKISIERSTRKRSFSPAPLRSVEHHSFSRSPVRRFSVERNISRSHSRSRERHFSSEKKSSFQKKDNLSGDRRREHVSKRDEKPRREHTAHISSTHKSRDDTFASHGRGNTPRGRAFRGRTFQSRGTFRGKVGFVQKSDSTVRFNPKYKIDRRANNTTVASSSDRVKDRSPRRRSEDRRSEDHKNDDRRKDERRKDSRRKDSRRSDADRVPEDEELTDFKSQLVDLFLQQSDPEATPTSGPYFLHDDREDSDDEQYRHKERLEFRGRGNRGFVPRSRGSGYVRKPYIRGRYRGASAWFRGRGRGGFVPRGRGRDYGERFRAQSPSGAWKHDKFDRHTDDAKD